ncbi:molecular chaperone TorD family protein [Helicobacter sp. faydin-H20]|uniref:TorD/DmsD family molecular chaperone n=1 Tax=Helicobacter anatolicus TaxID=2905874 RepID=UPI001E3CDE53|nr:molecular chaperone TorD family protein [Helicobacter anatolicus]MCE3036446.1 molecular chaperone TorD family protein [Helicobacter anatolicus]
MIEQKSLDNQIIKSRILYYDFLANLFLYELLEQKQEVLVKQVELLGQYPLDEINENDFKNMHAKLMSDFGLIVAQYTKIFSLPFSLDGKSCVSLYLSHYKEGCNGGESLVQVKRSLKENSFYLNKNFSKENEDHLGILCLFMKQLLQDDKIIEANKVYQEYIFPMKELIISGMRQFEECDFYLNVANIFEVFCILEDSICGLI